MSVPGTLYQLAALLVLVMPGFVYAAGRSRWRGNTYEDADLGVRVLRAMAVSAFLDAIYAVALGPHTYALAHSPGKAIGDNLARHSRELGLWAFVLVFVVPISLSFVVNGLAWSRNGRRVRARRRKAYEATPTAWEWATERTGGCYVRVLRGDGRWVGGYITRESYSATYPHDKDMFIRFPCRLDQDGRFIARMPDTLGMYVTIEPGDVVDWMRSPTQTARVNAEGRTEGDAR